MKRYMIQIIGSSKGIGEDLNEIADDRGVHFVDGKGLFLGTFYSQFETDEIHEMLADRPAFMIFDITDPNTSGINLPEKYFIGLFPETRDIDDVMGNIIIEEKVKTEKKNTIEEYNTVNDILDKLSRNDYNRDCLTENEVKILSNG